MLSAAVSSARRRATSSRSSVCSGGGGQGGRGAGEDAGGACWVRLAAGRPAGLPPFPVRQQGCPGGAHWEHRCCLTANPLRPVPARVRNQQLKRQPGAAPPPTLYASAAQRSCSSCPSASPSRASARSARSLSTAYAACTRPSTLQEGGRARGPARSADLNRVLRLRLRSKGGEPGEKDAVLQTMQRRCPSSAGRHRGGVQGRAGRAGTSSRAMTPSTQPSAPVEHGCVADPNVGHQPTPLLALLCHLQRRSRAGAVKLLPLTPGTPCCAQQPLPPSVDAAAPAPCWQLHGPASPPASSPRPAPRASHAPATPRRPHLPRQLSIRLAVDGLGLGGSQQQKVDQRGALVLASVGGIEARRLHLWKETARRRAGPRMGSSCVCMQCSERAPPVPGVLHGQAHDARRRSMWLVLFSPGVKTRVQHEPAQGPGQLLVGASSPLATC